MTIGQRLDKLLSTPDSGFNNAMQSIIWEHTPDQKFAPDLGIIDYMEVLHGIFFFCLENYETPYSCIERILTAPKEVKEDDDDYFLTVLDGILHLISVSDICDSMIILYVQLIDFRHKIAPWDEDEGVKAIIAEMEASKLSEANRTDKKPNRSFNISGQDSFTINTFEELFHNPDDLKVSVKILRDVTDRNRKSLINDLGRWIGKKGSLSILIAWFEVLQTRGKFKEEISDISKSILLNDYFPGLAFDTNDCSIWRKLTETRNKYHADFLQLIK